MKAAYVGVNGTPRSLKECYVGVGGVKRNVKEIYVGAGGTARLTWQYGINRLFYGYSSVGMGEIDPVTFAVIREIKSIVALRSLGGARRRLFASRVENGYKTLELDMETYGIIRSEDTYKNGETSSLNVGGTTTRLYRGTSYTGTISEIDMNTFAVIRTASRNESGDGNHGIAGTINRLFTFSGMGYSEDMMYERDPATLGIIRSINTVPAFRSNTAIDNQLLALNRFNYNPGKLSHRDMETMAILYEQVHPAGWEYIGGTKS